MELPQYRKGHLIGVSLEDEWPYASEINCMGDPHLYGIHVRGKDCQISYAGWTTREIKSAIQRGETELLPVKAGFFYKLWFVMRWLVRR